MEQKGMLVRVRALLAAALLLATSCTTDSAGAPPPVAAVPETEVASAGDTVPADRWRAVLIAGENNSPAFDNGVEAMRDKLAGRGVRNIRALTSDPVGSPSLEVATAANVSSALRSGGGEACLVFITSHGDESGVVLRAAKGTVQPSNLGSALDAGCGRRPTVVIVSACHSGVFLTPAMRQPNRVVLTAAAASISTPIMTSACCSSSTAPRPGASWPRRRVRASRVSSGAWASGHPRSRRSLSARPSPISGFPGASLAGPRASRPASYSCSSPPWGERLGEGVNAKATSCNTPSPSLSPKGERSMILSAADHCCEGARHVLRAVRPELLRVACRPRGFVGEQLHPFLVQRRASGRGLLHPELDLDDVVGCAASGFDAEPDLLEDVDDLAGQIWRCGASLRIASADHARHHDVTDAAGVGDRVLMLEAGIVDALALGHLR